MTHSPSVGGKKKATRAGGTSYSLDLLVCVVLTVVLFGTFLAIGPLPGIPMNDDFSYANTARGLAEQGRMVYNGWACPMLFPQAAYGAAIIRTFGFSYLALEWSGVVMALIAAVLMYGLARACGCGRWAAGVGTACLVLNPIYLSNAPSFMTDIPSLVLLLVSLLLLVRAVRTGGGSIDGRLLALATAAGVIAGTNRQVSWLAFAGALIGLYVQMPRARRPLGFALAAVVAAAALLTVWFSRQPYTVPANIGPGLFRILVQPETAVLPAYRLCSLIGLFSLPLVLLAVWARGRALARSVAVITLILVALRLIPIAFRDPWGRPRLDLEAGNYGNYFSPSGVRLSAIVGWSQRPDAWPPAVTALLAAAGAVGLAVLVFTLGRQMAKSYRRMKGNAEPDSRRVVAVSLLLATVAQIGFMLPWYAIGQIYDRYTLLLMPGPIIALGSLVRMRRLGAFPKALSAAGVLVVWGLGYLNAGDYMAYSRAKRDIIALLQRQNFLETQIDAGMDICGDVQVRRAGYMNCELMTNPPNAYNPRARGRNVATAGAICPIVDARYILSVGKPPKGIECDPAPFATVRYRSPLPPHARAVYAYRVTHPEIDAATTERF